MTSAIAYAYTHASSPPPRFLLLSLIELNSSIKDLLFNGFDHMVIAPLDGTADSESAQKNEVF